MALFKQHLGLLIAKETSSGDQRSKSYIASSQDFQRRNSGEKQKETNLPRLEPGLSKHRFSLNIKYLLMLNSAVFVEKSCFFEQNVWGPKLNSYITVWAENPSTSIAPVLRS